MMRFAIRHMATKWVKLLLVLLSIVISASVALLAYNVSGQVESGIVKTAAYYDMIIGPAGSSTQLAMNTMFFTDSPLGTIPYSIVEDLEKDPEVNAVVPFTMGDSYNSARIVGTTPAFLTGKSLARGEMFRVDGLYECVVGSGVAEKYDLSVGDEIVSSHGLTTGGSEHAASPFTITGILARTDTAYDNAVFTSYKTVWAVHGLEEHDHEEEGEHEEAEAAEGSVCAILVRTASFNAYYKLSSYYATDASLLVINPSTVLREVLDNVDVSTNIVYVLCAVILVMNLFVITVITILNMYDARPEITLMRLVGIGMGKINWLMMTENAIVGAVATGLSFLASRMCLRLMGDYVADMGIVLSGSVVYPLEWAIMGVVFAVSVLPTAISTVLMSRKDGIK